MEQTSNYLGHCLDLVHRFLISNVDSQAFPGIAVSIEDILLSIAKDIKHVKHGVYSDYCKSLIANIMEILEKNKEVFSLGCDYESDEQGKKVLVYKKLPVSHFQKPETVRYKPLRKPNITQKSENNAGSVMSNFKIACLNSTLKFVKLDSQLVLKYPNMSTEQADLIKQMIEECLARNMPVVAGFKGLYDPLCEALQIYSLKYDFKLHCETSGDVKQLKFEKIKKLPDNNEKENSDLDSSSIDADCIMPSKKQRRKVRLAVNAVNANTPQFKQRVIGELNAFLKDKARETHTFSDLSKTEHQFVMHWQELTKRVEVIQLFEVRDQMVLDEMRDTLKSCNFKIKLGQNCVSPNNRSVEFTKFTLEQLNAAKLKSTSSSGNSSSNTSFSSTGTSEGCGKGVFMPKTKEVSEEWLNATLMQLNDFLQNENDASLILPMLFDPEKAFLVRWQHAILHNPGLQTAYKPPVRQLLSRITENVAVNKDLFTINFRISGDKKTMRKAIFEKVPFPDKIPKVCKDNVPVNKAPKPNENKVAVENDSKEGIMSQSAAAKKSIPTVSRAASQTEDARSKSTDPRYSNYNAFLAKNVSQEKVKNVSQEKVKNVSQAKVKLMEGLSQPLVSNVGMKLMRQMGWEGGALGLRGQGIVEPIMPPLDLAKGAGLGAPKAKLPKVQARTIVSNIPNDIIRICVPYSPDKNELKKGLLETVLKMTQDGDEKPTEVTFPSKLTLKQWGYMKFIITTFNNRGPLPLEPPEVTATFSKILKKIGNSELALTACWGVSKMNILLILSHYDAEADIDKNVWCSVLDYARTTTKQNAINVIAPPDDAKKTVKAGPVKETVNAALKETVNAALKETVNAALKETVKAALKETVNAALKETVKAAGDSNKSVMVQGEAFRYYVLSQILDFCKKPHVFINKHATTTKRSHDIALKGTMTPKQMSFIEDVIVRLNAGARASSESTHEATLHREILEAIQRYTLHVYFPVPKNADPDKPVHKIIRLHKIFKSEDLKTTAAPSAGAAVKPVNPINNNCDAVINKHIENSNETATKKSHDNYNRDKATENTEEHINNAFKTTQTPQEHLIDALTNTRHATNASEIASDNSKNNIKNDRNDVIVNNNNIIVYLNNDSQTIENGHLVSDRNGKDIDDGADCICCFSISKLGESIIDLDNQNIKEKTMDELNGSTLTEIQDTEKKDKKNLNETTSVVVKKEMEIVNPVENVNSKSTDDSLDAQQNKINSSGKKMINDVDRNSGVPKTDKENGSTNSVSSFVDRAIKIITEIDKTYSAFCTDNQFDRSVVDKENLPVNDVNKQTCNDNNIEIVKNVTKEEQDKVYMLSHRNGDGECVDSMKNTELTVNNNWKDGVNHVKSNEKQFEVQYGKRQRSAVNTPEKLPKKCRYNFVKNLSIMPKDLVQTVMTNKMAAKVQNEILNSINYTQVELPLLKCHGIKNGALSYSCHNEKSWELIKNVIESLDLKFTLNDGSQKETFKVSFRINTFIDESLDSIFKRLEGFNPILTTKDWVFLKKEQYSDYTVIFVDIDSDSLKFIRSEHFKLYVGIDEAQFSVVWS